MSEHFAHMEKMIPYKKQQKFFELEFFIQLFFFLNWNQKAKFRIQELNLIFWYLHLHHCNSAIYFK